VLTGTFTYAMDAKGRVVIPAAFRQQLGGSFVLIRAPGRCLLALPRPQWIRTARAHARRRAFRTFFLSAARNVTVQLNYRIQVPHDLREWAGLHEGTDAVLAGVGGAVVISSRARWNERLARLEGELLQSLAGGQKSDQKIGHAISEVAD
jgi:MraZ protein